MREAAAISGMVSLSSLVGCKGGQPPGSPALSSRSFGWHAL